ncbi:hypothetical protein PoB_002484000 [Plakobranchus ocellatus]|uniref:Uncharacterized protein n=1 Tax=Plakobranchus ocellatus TaxID=259542 RepID=A0AAV3ZUM4_9GAST|nr:hypothetical protein PoB_002484000 [Plakobranchus ocellatus]
MPLVYFVVGSIFILLGRMPRGLRPLAELVSSLFKKFDRSRSRSRERSHYHATTGQGALDVMGAGGGSTMESKPWLSHV